MTNTDTGESTSGLQHELDLIRYDVEQLKIAVFNLQEIDKATQNALLCIPCPKEPTEYTVGSCPDCTCTLGPAVADVGAAIDVIGPPPDNIVPPTAVP